MRVPSISNLGLVGENPGEFLDVLLVEQMSDDGDFENTVFLEMIGKEPTKHPSFAEITVLLRAKIAFLGLMSDGSFVGNEDAESGVKELDLVTLTSSGKMLDKAVDFLVSRNVPCLIRITKEEQDLSVEKHKGKPKVFFEYGPTHRAAKCKSDCLDLYTSSFVRWDGAVFRCPNTSAALGSINKETLQEMWELEKPKTQPECKLCLEPSSFASKMSKLAYLMKEMS